jgi:hypothetical protein
MRVFHLEISFFLLFFVKVSSNFSYFFYSTINFFQKVNAVRTMNEHFTDNSAIWLTHKLIKRTAASDPLLPWLEKSYDELYFLLLTQVSDLVSLPPDLTITASSLSLH